MTRLSSPNPIQLLSISFVLMLMSACGGGSGPSLPMRPDAGGMDGGVMNGSTVGSGAIGGGGAYDRCCSCCTSDWSAWYSARTCVGFL